MDKHKSNKINENSNTVSHLIMGQITTTQNLVAIKEVRHAGQTQNEMWLLRARILWVINPHKNEMWLPLQWRHNDVIKGAMASQITSPTSIYPTVYSGADQRKHQSSAPLAFVRGIHRRPVNSQHKGPVTRKKFPFDDVIMLRAWILGVIRNCRSVIY